MITEDRFFIYVLPDHGCIEYCTEEQMFECIFFPIINEMKKQFIKSPGIKVNISFRDQKTDETPNLAGTIGYSTKLDVLPEIEDDLGTICMYLPGIIQNCLNKTYY